MKKISSIHNQNIIFIYRSPKLIFRLKRTDREGIDYLRTVMREFVENLNKEEKVRRTTPSQGVVKKLLD